MKINKKASKTVFFVGLLMLAICFILPASAVEAALPKAEITKQGDVSLLFTEAMQDAKGTGLNTQFSLEADGVTVDITDVQNAGEVGKVKLVLKEKISSAKEVTINYTKGDNDEKQLKTGAGDTIDSFTVYIGNAAPAPVLGADISDYKLGQPMIITFEDNQAWRDSITGISINDGLINGKYIISPGEITIIDADLFNTPKDYVITVVASGFKDAKITLSINPAEETAPAPVLSLAAVTKQGDISLEFDKPMADPAGTHEQFAVTVNESAITVNAVEATNTKEKIKLVLETKVSNDQVIHISYIKGQTAAQQIKSQDGGVVESFAAQIGGVYASPPELKAHNRDNYLGNDIELTFTDISAWRNAITDITAGGNSIKGKYTIEKGKIRINSEVFTSAKTYNIVVKATWYKDAGLIQTITKPITGDKITVDGDNKNLAITETSPVATITVSEVATDATISVASLLQTAAGNEVQTQPIPNTLNIEADTSLSASPIKMEIPGGTTIKAPAAWDGTIKMPALQTNDSVTVAPDQGKTATVKAVIEVGYGDTPLIFSKAIKLVLPGQAGKDVGYYQSGVFTKITNVCQENSQAWADANLPEGGDGRIDVNGDLVIWTKHFTSFVVYEQNSSGGSSSGGNSSGDGSGTGADTGTPGGLTVSFTAVRSTPGDTLLHFDFSNGMDKNLDDSLKLIRVFEKATGKNVSYSSYKYDKEGNKDTGDKVRRIELNFDNLKAGTKYGVELGAALKANNGSTLGIKKSFEFTTSATAAGGSKPVEQGIDSSGGKISGNGVTVDIPAAALDSKVKVLIELLADTSKLPLAEKSKLIGDVAEITIDKTANFKKPVIVTLKFDKSKVDLQKQDIAICYLDEKAGKWVALNNVKVDLSAGTVSGEVSHFTKFAVIATEKADISQPISELSDIKGHWSEKSIAVLVKSGAIGGYPDGTFKPDQGISRAEFVTILVKAFQLSAQNGKVFDDTANHWGRQFIATAAANGIVSGYSETAFGPDDLITREQMTVMIVKAAGLKTGASKPASFTDGDQISSWAAEAVSVSASQGIVNGYPDSTFRPHGTATRAEAVTVIAQTQKIAI